MKIRNLSSRNLYLRDSSNTEYRVPAYSDITVTDTLWNDNEFRRWVRYRVRDIAVVDTSASITASTLINTGDPLTVPLTIRGAVGQNVSLMQIQDSTLATLFNFTKLGKLGIGTSPLSQFHVLGAIDSNGGQVRVDASTSNSNAALSLFPNRAGSLFEAARLLATYNGALQGQLQFYTNNGAGTLIQRGMFDETGAFGVGATPTARLDIATAATGDIATFRSTASGGQGLLFGVDTTNSRAYVRMNTSSTYSYTIQNTSGTPMIQWNNSDGKTYFGSNQTTNLYRLSDGNLKTDTNFLVGGNVTVTGSLTTGSLAFSGGSVTGALTVSQEVTARSSSATQVILGTVNTDKPGILFGATSNANLYSTGAGALKSDGGLTVGVVSTQSFVSLGAIAVGTGAAGTTVANGITFGSGADVTLYRSAATTLKTDGALTVVGALTAASYATTGLLSLQSRVANELSLINTNTNGTAAIRLQPSGTPTDVLTISSIGNVTLPVTAANTTPTLFLGAEAIYRSATGTVKTDSGLTVAGVTQHGASTPVSNALVSAVASGNGIEFGHTNGAGYRSTLGATSTSGQQFLALHGEHGTAANTIRSRGVRSSVIISDLSGGFYFGNVASASADSQTVTAQLTLTNTGALTALGTVTGSALTTAGAITGASFSVSGTGAIGGTLTFGGDTNLYRSAADTLKTDDSFVVLGTTTLAGAASIAGAVALSSTLVVSGATTLGITTTSTLKMDDGVTAAMIVQRHPYANARHMESGAVGVTVTNGQSNGNTVSFTNAFGSAASVVTGLGSAGTLLASVSQLSPSTTGFSFSVGGGGDYGTTVYWHAEQGD